MPISASPSTHLYIGIDGGASNIRISLINQERSVLHTYAVQKSANYHVVGLTATVDALTSAVMAMLAECPLPPPVIVDASVVGLAGCNFAHDAQVLHDAIRRSSLSHILGRSFEVVNDAEVALRAGTADGGGVIIVAGTGSNCFGRYHGQTARASGVDYLLSDEGGGYDIGLRALRSVVRGLDGRGDVTLLTDKIYDFLGVDSLETLYRKVYTDFTSKEHIASLATLVTDAAAEQDQVARDILVHSVNELMRMVDAVVGRLNLKTQPLDVISVGSLFQHDSFFTLRFDAELRRVAPKARRLGLTQPASVGAAWMALEADQG